jgi:tetratricopeptide (TPR) repeat protein
VSFSGLLRLFTLTVLLVSSGCRSRSEEQPRLLYVPPLVNLSADPSLDWFGRAVSGLIIARTAGGGRVQFVGAETQKATHELEGYFSERGGVVHVHSALRDLASQKVITTADSQGPVAELFRISETLAQRVAGPVRPYTTSSVDAVRNLYRAVGSSSAEEVLKLLDAAIAADAGYGSAHLARIQTLGALNRRDEATKALEAAAAPSVRFTEEEKLRVQEMRAAISGDVAARARVMRDLARLRSGDVQLWRAAADLFLLLKDYSAAIDCYKNAVKIEPDNIVFWNSLGYAHAYAGNLSSAKSALDEYRRLAPADANALDSLGEVHYHTGRFAEAEKYFLDAFNKNKTLLGGGEALRAAMARLMMGDLATADQHFAKYIEVRKQAGDSLVPVRQALWRFWTGHRTEAMAALAKINDPPAAAAAARFLLTLWQIEFGDLEQARKMAAAASGGGAVRRQLLGYSLLLQRNYPDAVQLWSEVYNNTSGLEAKDERILLAWAHAGRNNLAEVATLVRAYPLPFSAAEPSPQAILFPRMLFLKALAEQHANNREDAKRLFKLFLEYSKDRDLSYGEESRAREALAKL